MSKAVMFWLALILVLAGGMVVWYAMKRRASEPLAEIRKTVPQVDESWRDEDWIEDFTLIERNGVPVSSQDLRGQVWVASFFFASCPSTCTQQNRTIQTLQQQLDDPKLKFVSITCDPTNDTPERLRDYARGFQADPQRWLFLTGDLNHIRRIGAEKFQVSVSERGHSDRLLAVDKWGQVRQTFDWHKPEELLGLKLLVKQLLAETDPPVDQLPVDDPPSAAPPADLETVSETS